MFTGANGTQTAAEQQANIANQQATLLAQTNQRIANGTLDPNSQEAQTNLQLATTNQYIDPGTEASQAFWSGIGSGGTTGTGPGVGSVLSDIGYIAIVGAGIWAFFEFGGVGFVKSLAKKSKWYVVGILAGVALLLWYIWSLFNKTASDTSSTISGVEAGLSAVNPFGSSTTS